MKYGIIDYDVIGTGMPVLIIHGWGISKLTMKGAFEPIFSEVDGYKRFYIDLPGMGNSEHGDVKNSDDILKLLHGFAVDIIREILGYFRILGPVILIVFIGLDFGGAILSQDNAALTKAGSKVVSRCIGVALLYFVPTLVRFILGLPGVQEAIVISDDPLCNTMNSPAIVEVMK